MISLRKKIFRPRRLVFAAPFRTVRCFEMAGGSGTKLKSVALGVVLAFSMGFVASAAPGTNQPPLKTNEGTVRLLKARGRIDEYYPVPHETQIKSHVEFARTTPTSQPGVALIADVKAETWLVNGQPELVLETPECNFNQSTRTFNSPGPLKIHTGDGRFSIEGQGFTFYQTNSVLFLSNQVHTTVHPATNSTSAAASPARPPGPGTSEIEVFSDRFQFSRETGLGIYQGHVRVAGTNLAMTCGLAEVSAPTDTRALQSIKATNAVVIDYETGDQNIRKIHVTGDEAIYLATNGTTTITGHPTWRADERDGYGDELVLDETNKTFRATGNAFLRIPAQTLGENSFLPGTPSPQPHQIQPTNAFVEVNCDHYLLQTNFASFGDQVRVTRLTDGRPAGLMTCSNMTLYFGGTNQLERMIAERHVVIEQTTNNFTADKAVYTGANQLLELTGDPEWHSGERHGKGEVVQVNVRDEQMRVMTNAFMRLPANQLGESFSPGGLSPQRAGSPTNRLSRTGSTRAAKAPAERTRPAGPQFADINCDQYVVGTNFAQFTGHVRVDHPQMDWVCDSLRVASAADSGKDTRLLIAERGVDFHITNERGDSVHGTCEKAVYDYQAAAGKTNSVMTLTGSPKLKAEQGTITNKIIILDLISHTIRAPGKYLLYGEVVGAGTNVLGKLSQPTSGKKKKSQ
jgi:lipopolysaccharide export system protein LptA